MTFNTVVRTHIKTVERLKLLEKTIKSWYASGLNNLGQLYIADDQSWLKEEVARLANQYDAILKVSTGAPSTCNGLYNALQAQDTFPCLQMVDDIVLATNLIKTRINAIINDELPKLDNPAIVGLFIPYPYNVRKPLQVSGTKLYKHPTDNWSYHATVCHIFTKEIADLYCRDWENVSSKMTNAELGMHDDHYLLKLIRDNQKNIYISMLDYAWHTGVKDRSFIPEFPTGGSEYQASLFCGTDKDKEI